MELDAQLNKLEDTILSNVHADFPNQLTAEERALVNAYLVLAHAVLEEEVEDAFLAAYDQLALSLSQPSVPIETVRLVFALRRWVPADVFNSSNSIDLYGFVAQICREQFLVKLDKNNGLKEYNIKSLAKLLGLDWTAFEDAHSDQLADLNTLGSKRGAAGHMSPFSSKTTGLTEGVDPDDVRLWVQYGLDAVVKLKGYLKDLAGPES